MITDDQLGKWAISALDDMVKTAGLDPNERDANGHRVSEKRLQVALPLFRAFVDAVYRDEHRIVPIAMLARRGESGR